jgi:ABC-type multidrug transport system fused ATPase/permease subunit
MSQESAGQRLPGQGTGPQLSGVQTLVLIRRSLHFAWPFRLQIGVKILLSLLGVFLVLFLPWPAKILIDHVIMGIPVGDSHTLYPPYVMPFVDSLAGLSPYGILASIIAISVVGMILIGGFGTGGSQDRTADGLAQGLDTATQSENLANESSSSVSGLLGLFEYWYQLRTTHRINHRLRCVVYGRMMSLPMIHFADTSIGDSVYRVMYDTPSISRVCYDIMVLPVISLALLASVIWTMQYSFSDVPSLVMIAWLAAPLTLFTTFLMTGVTRRRAIASRTAGAGTTANIEEGMSNIIAVQSLGASDKQLKQFEAVSDESFKRFRMYSVMPILLAVLQGSVVLGLVFYVFFDVVDALVDGRMSPGDYGVLFAYFIQIATATSGLGALWFNLQNSVTGMQRVFQVLDMAVDVDHHGDTHLTEPVRQVQLENVSFTYPDGSIALDAVHLEGHVGEMVALVGATGAGKTTLAYLIPGFVRPTVGRVLFNGVDTRELDLGSVRDQVAFVFQEPVIFDDTVANNIRMGYPEATDSEVREAASTAGALGFIEDLPLGFETSLGRAGSTLSVGQKQRLAIARGLVSRARVLVLDEPTAALDAETEAALMTALAIERKRRLLIVIAHRLSTIRSADRIVFLADGRVLESASHDELMANPDGAYRRFVDLQTAASGTSDASGKGDSP